MNLPPCLTELFLSYLPYPDLLKIENLDFIKVFLRKDTFWRKILRDSFFETPKDSRDKSHNFYRLQYHKKYIRQTIEDDSSFELGYFNISLDQEDFLLIEVSSENTYNYIMGALVGGHEDLIVPLDSYYSKKALKCHKYLHSGDSEGIKEFKHCNFSYELGYSSDLVSHCTTNMIDHSIRFKFETPGTIFAKYRRAFHSYGMSNKLLTWFLHKYGSEISLEDLRDKLTRLTGYIELSSLEEKRYRVLYQVSTEEVHKQDLMAQVEDYSIRTMKEKKALFIISQYIAKREEDSAGERSSLKRKR